MSASRVAALAFVCVIGLAPLVASAQNVAIQPPAQPEGAFRLTTRWDSYVFTTHTASALASVSESGLTAWTNVLSTQLDVGAAVVRVAIPLGYGRAWRPGRSGAVLETDQAELGNVSLEALGEIGLGASEHRLLLGGGVAAPTATDQMREDLSELSGRGVRSLAWSTSFRSPAYWQEHSLAVWLSGEYRLAIPWFLLTATAAVPVFFPTNERLGGPLMRGNVELMMTVDVSAAVRVLDLVDIGAAFLAWAMPSGAGALPDERDLTGTLFARPDLGQTSLTVFVRTDDALESPIGGGLEMVLNLDGGWGPTGGAGRYWGAHAFLTAAIDG